MSKANRKTTTRKARPSIPALCQSIIQLQSKADHESLRRSRVQKAVDAAMPRPHPSITFGPKQDRDGSTLSRGCNPHARYIWPALIRTEIHNAKHENPAERIDTVGYVTVRIPTTKPELTPGRRALIARLEARLKLAEDYRTLYEKRCRAAGLKGSSLERMWAEIARREARVARRKSRTWADLAAKVGLYKTEPVRFREEIMDGDNLVVSIVEDAARLLKAKKAVRP